MFSFMKIFKINYRDSELIATYFWKKKAFDKKNISNKKQQTLHSVEEENKSVKMEATNISKPTTENDDENQTKSQDNAESKKKAKNKLNMFKRLLKNDFSIKKRIGLVKIGARLLSKSYKSFHFKIKNINLVVGIEDQEKLGYILAIIYVILHKMKVKNYAITPEFNKKVLDFSIEIKGYFVVITLFWILLIEYYRFKKLK